MFHTCLTYPYMQLYIITYSYIIYVCFVYLRYQNVLLLGQNVLVCGGITCRNMLIVPYLIICYLEYGLFNTCSTNVESCL